RRWGVCSVGAAIRAMMAGSLAAAARGPGNTGRRVGGSDRGGGRDHDDRHPATFARGGHLGADPLRGALRGRDLALNVRLGFVALVRLVPLVPFNLLNYALGLTWAD